MVYGVIAAWLIKTSVVASVIIFLIVVVKYLMKRAAYSRWHYYIWFLLLVRLVLPFSPESPVSIFKYMKVFEEKSVVAEVEKVEKHKAYSDVNKEGQSPLYVENRDSKKADVVLEPQTEDVTEYSLIEADRDAKNRILVIVWLGGVAATALYLLFINLLFWFRIKDGTNFKDTEIMQLLENAKEEMNIKTNIHLIQTSGVNIPALFGVVRPWLLMPANIIEELGRRDIHYVILHELAHLKRNDILINWILFILQIVFWFHPLVWYAFNRIRKDREIDCDSTVLDVIGPARHREYGNTIIRMVEHFSRELRHGCMAGILESKAEAARRISMIAHYRKRAAVSQLITVVLLTVFSFTLLGEANETVRDNMALKEAVPVQGTKAAEPMEMSVGNVLKSYLRNSRYPIEIDKYKLVHSADKAELWLCDAGLPQICTDTMIDFINKDISRIENYLGAFVKKETGKYGKIVYIIVDGPMYETLGSTVLRTKDEPVVLISRKCVLTRETVESYIFPPTARILCRNASTDWIKEGLPFYICVKLSRYGGERNENMERGTVNVLKNDKEFSKLVLGYSWKQSNETITKDVFRRVSGSFVKYLDEKIGMNEVMYVYKAKDVRQALVERTGKELSAWKDEWIRSLRDGDYGWE